jgi:hypothetical protein
MVNHNAVACSLGANIASVVHRLGMLELANTAMGLSFPVTRRESPPMPCLRHSRQSR